MNELKSKTTLPSHTAVLVCEVRENGNLWPLARIDQRQDDHLSFISGASAAPRIIAVLEKAHACAVRKATDSVAANMIAKLASKSTPETDPEAKTLKENSQL